MLVFKVVSADNLYNNGVKGDFNLNRYVKKETIDCLVLNEV